MRSDDAPAWGWFDRAPGVVKFHRRLKDQIRGLAPLRAMASGAAVLDLGAAEGLIGFWLLELGARHLDAVELVPGRVARAREIATALPASKRARIFEADLEDFAGAPPPELGHYEIVLALSIAQKLSDPAAFLAAAARRCLGVMAVRLPEPVIKDARSRYRPVDVPSLLREEGFRPLGEALRLPNGRSGEREEWLGLFEKV